MARPRTTKGRRIVEVLPGRKRQPTKDATKLIEVVHAGGVVKHNLMTARLESGDTSSETRHCPICEMHCTRNEAMNCLMCGTFAEYDMTVVTSTEPIWWATEEASNR